MKKDLKTATHKYDTLAKATFMAPESALSPLNSGNFLNKFQRNFEESALLPMDSGIPKMNPKKLNEDIQNTRKKENKKAAFAIQSPLTAFNIREKQYKRSLSGTYGPDYKEKAEQANKNENDKDYKAELEQEVENLEMYECLRDLNMSKSSEIPDNYLYQPQSHIRYWMEKRGKKELKLSLIHI